MLLYILYCTLLIAVRNCNGHGLEESFKPLYGNEARIFGQPPTSCAEAFMREYKLKSGVYNLYLPLSGLKPFPVYCMEDPDGGAAWTVIQKRVDKSIDFYLDWADYKIGFGSLNTNFFIGLEKLHALTTYAMPQELWVQLRDTNHTVGSAYYENFAIADEQTKYTLNVLGPYKGTAGDSLRLHNGKQFATRDADHNTCAKKFHGAWWYDNCHHSNLNGLYGSSEFGKGLNWKDFRGHTASMEYVHMAIRPAGW